MFFDLFAYLFVFLTKTAQAELKTDHCVCVCEREREGGGKRHSKRYVPLVTLVVRTTTTTPVGQN